MALTTVPASLSATALTLTTAAQPNITSVGTLTGLTVSGNIAGTLTTAAQTNITSVGTLSALTVSGGVTAARFDATTASTTDPVLQLTDSGVADYDFTFPDTSTIQLGTSTTSDKTFKLLNSGSGTFNLNVEGISTFGTGSYTNSQYYASDVVINAANEGGLTIANSANSHASYIMFADGVSSGSEQYAGYIEYNHSADRMRVKSNGTFQIYATGLGGDALTIASAGAATFGSRINFAEHIIGSTSGGYLQMRGTGSRYWVIGSTGGNTAPTTASATLGFHHYDGSSWTQNKVNITASGKLGLGTSNPDVPLQVSGDSTAGGILIKQGAQIAYTPSSLANFRQGITFENTASGHAYSIGYGQGGRLKFSYFDNSSTYEELAQLRPGGDFYPAGSVVMASGEGINFSAAPNSNSGAAHSLLDDYEEGSFLPRLFVGSSELTVSNNVGRYTKIGNVVIVRGTMTRNDSSSPTGNLSIRGFPFSMQDVAYLVTQAMGHIWVDNGTGSDRIGVAYMNSSTYMYGVVDKDIRTGRYLQGQNLTNGRPVYFCCTYHTAQ